MSDAAEITIGRLAAADPARRARPLRARIRFAGRSYSSSQVLGALGAAFV